MEPQKGCKNAISMSSRWSTSPITMKIFQQVCSVKRSKLAKFRDDISIEEVMTSQIFWYDIKIWWRHISVKNFGIALKLCRLFDLVIAIICTNFCEFSQSRFWFTEIPSFTDVVYLWRHWLLPTTCYKWHGLKTRKANLNTCKVSISYHKQGKIFLQNAPPGWGINKTFWHFREEIRAWEWLSFRIFVHNFLATSQLIT